MLCICKKILRQQKNSTFGLLQMTCGESRIPVVPECNSSKPCYKHSAEYITEFNKHCSGNDFCAQGSQQFSCPIKLPERSHPDPMDCIYRPRGHRIDDALVCNQGQPAVNGSIGTAQQLANDLSQPGCWNCTANLWLPSRSNKLHIFETPQVLDQVDAIVTYGDSLTRNIYTGLSAILGNYSQAEWHHSRQSTTSENGSALPLRHVCCNHCECGLSNASRLVLEWAQSVAEHKAHRKFRVLVIMRATIHFRVLKSASSVKSMAEEILTLMSLLESPQHTGGPPLEFFYIWVPMHGSGVRKPKVYLMRQSTRKLRTYDEGILAFLARSRPDLFRSLIVLDIFNLVESAEATCDGLYSSVDGTHLSFTVFVTVAQMVLNIARALGCIH